MGASKNAGRAGGPAQVGLALGLVAAALGIWWAGSRFLAEPTPPAVLRGVRPAPTQPPRPSAREEPKPAPAAAALIRPPATPVPAAPAQPASQPDLSVLERVPLTRPLVALTIDLGETTTRPALEAMLDLLAEKEVDCTFFVTGWFVRTYPDLLRRIKDDGHDLGNHTDKHPHCKRISGERLEQELTVVERLLEEQGMSMSAPKYFRPPYGEYNASVVKTAAGLGYRTVTWSATAVDYNRTGDAEAVARALVRRSGPGGIILMHAGPVSQQALPLVVEALSEKGYTLTTLKRLVEAAREE